MLYSRDSGICKDLETSPSLEVLRLGFFACNFLHPQISTLTGDLGPVSGFRDCEDCQCVRGALVDAARLRIVLRTINFHESYSMIKLVSRDVAIVGPIYV